MSIWTELLFQHGHVADVELARSLARAPAPPAEGRDRGGCDAASLCAAPGDMRCRGTFPAHGMATLCSTALSLFR